VVRDGILAIQCDTSTWVVYIQRAEMYMKSHPQRHGGVLRSIAL